MSEKVFDAFLDRFEDGMAVLLLGEDEQHTLVLPAELIPEEAREGAALVISIRFDPEVTAKSREEVERLLEKLRHRDGDTGPDGVNT